MDEAGNSVEPEALTALTGFVGTKGNQIYVEQVPFYKIKKLQLVGSHWYAICFVPGGPGFKSRQGRELLILNKKELLI